MAVKSTSPKLNTEAHFRQTYDYVIRCIDREDNLRHQRLSWALQINIGVALVVVLNLRNGVDLTSIVAGFVAAVIGITFTAVSYRAVVDAKDQIEYLKEALLGHSYLVSDSNNSDDLIKEISGFPRPFGDENLMRIGNRAPKIYCFGIIFTWGTFVFFLFYQMVQLFT